MVDILRSLPSKVHLICGRHDRPPTVIKEDLPSQREVEEVIPEVVPHVESARLPISPEPEVKESVEEEEEGAQAVEETLTVISGDSVSLHSDTPSGMSHESLMGVSVWSDQVQLVTLHKGDQGLGFSILDYQVGGPYRFLLLSTFNTCECFKTFRWLNSEVSFHKLLPQYLKKKLFYNYFFMMKIS